MASFSDFKDQYENNWGQLQIRDGRVADAQKQARRLLQGKATYQEVEGKTRVPWWFVGLCHYRESAFNFDTYLGNGQSLSRPTTIEPKGRGPFTGPNAFVDGAIDALHLEHLLNASDWGIARTLFRLEGFNGYGYHSQGVNSPYLYGGSTCYGPPQARGGKYVRDHVFDPHFVDTQLGTAVILKSLLALDSSITFSVPPTVAGQPDQPDDEFARDILWVQQSLNTLGINPQLTEDGKNGPLTMGAVSQFQRQHGLRDTGIADVATIAAIQRALTPPAPAPAIGVLTQRVAPPETGFVAPSVNAGNIQRPAVGPGASEPNDRAALLARLLEIVQDVQAPATTTPAPTASQLADQLKRAAELLTGALAPGNGSQPLGQVNGALGETLGNLLNGKKAAIGIIGASLTSVLSQVPPGSGLGDVLTKLTPAAGLSPFSMPICLALAAWGVLGKFEKWTQGTAPGPLK